MNGRATEWGCDMDNQRRSLILLVSFPRPIQSRGHAAAHAMAICNNVKPFYTLYTFTNL
jgi:hypothetical protein